ncbi:hypothetical protein NIE88_02085 [Sporolactobacillus shoreicorticis]|uniref:Uncharacterized protein n=1 Tax=Sporolactobacillus shoreicorticis TaxID=1923877 RepID=A0ABW5S2K5_9BACL|nr:hypothetical protein [Sporolactobacillus shoreicorticis]MCO7124569.1 hypothetical protein [Sporolactobacillus shoreicorticis]
MFRGEPISTYYSPQLEQIDEKICALIQERKKIAGDNPELPSEETFQSWGKKFGHYPDMLREIFTMMQNEDVFRPRVEPKKFRCFVPVMSGQKFGDQMICVTHLRQYENASVLSLTVASPFDYKEHDDQRQLDYELKIPDSSYDCRSDDGSGSEGLWIRNYIITPAIPDELPDLKLVFQEQEFFPKQKRTGNVFELNLRKTN